MFPPDGGITNNWALFEVFSTICYRKHILILPSCVGSVPSHLTSSYLSSYSIFSSGVELAVDLACTPVKGGGRVLLSMEGLQGVRQPTEVARPTRGTILGDTGVHT